MNFWLHRLFLDLLDSDPNNYLFQGQKDVSGTIQSVCAASARFCLRLAKKATEHQNGFGVETGESTGKLLRASTPGKATPPASKGDHKRKRDHGVAQLRLRVRKLRNDGLTHQEVCDRLGSAARPPRARWRDLPWPLAYKRHTSAVTKWLSEACS
jgi:hypothetical protein